jgi:hypothetical protein
MNPLVIPGAVALAALALDKASAREAAARTQAEAALKAAPTEDAAQARAGEATPSVTPPAAEGPPPVFKPAVPKAAGVAATVFAGIKANAAVGDFVEKVAGEGAGDVARINISLAPALLAKEATQRVLAHVGAPPGVAKHVGITVGTVALVGAPGVAIKAGAELLSAGIKVVAGKKTEQAVRNAVSQFDPTKKGSLANKAISPISKGVKALGKLF